MSFSDRLKKIANEFGSRYALAKVSGIPASTLQSYEAGSKPGMDALATLARVANVDINWLLSGKGEMRPSGLLSGAVLADVLMVDQYELGTQLAAESVIGQLPFSRSFLEARLHLKAPMPETLLAVQAGSELLEVSRGDLVLIDRDQANLARDGIYLVDLPGIELRAVFRQPNRKVRVLGPGWRPRGSGLGGEADGGRERFGEVVITLEELLGFNRPSGSKIIGRSVWIGRAI